jgi:hypothetical protein
MSDILSINEFELTLILKIIGQYDVNHIITLPIKRITSVLKVLTYIIVAILVIMTVLAFKADVILNVFYYQFILWFIRTKQRN